MHFVSDFHSKGSISIKLLLGIDLGVLKLIKVDVIFVSFDCVLLCELAIFEIVILDFFSFLPKLIVKIIDAMCKITLFLLEHAQPSKIESTE
jgi:hypothetical protein